MSFLYCDRCGWTQDDFWSRRYNPIFSWWQGNVSWRLCWKRLSTMHWWTRKSWRKAVARGEDVCPKCKQSGYIWED